MNLMMKHQGSRVIPRIRMADIPEIKEGATYLLLPKTFLNRISNNNYCQGTTFSTLGGELIRITTNDFYCTV